LLHEKPEFLKALEIGWCLLLAYRILAGKVPHSFIVHM